ncbi:MAG: PIN domain-containing protein, partial [Methanosarcinales archaeon]
MDFFLDLWNGEDEIYSSVITEAELLSGKSCNNPEVRTKTEDIINTTIKVNVNSNIAKRAGKYRRMYDISLSDALIASTAKEIGAKL